jgi:hypothetical protein
LIFTLRRPTDVIFEPPSEWSWLRGLPGTVISLLLGWWGVPWGIIYTPIVIVTNLTGGCDVTAQARAWLESQLGPDTEPLSCELA